MPSGYARVTIVKRPTFKTYYLHRVVFEYFNGETDLCVCHKCDNPSCINPEHLFAGTQRENILDAVKKGRWTQQRTKFDAKDIKAIREATEPAKAVAERFGTTASYIYRIRNGHVWKSAS